MKRIILSILILACVADIASAQYAPQAGISGSTAIKATSSLFVGWATGCTVQRGYLNIADTSLGYVTSGDTSSAIGAIDHNVLSLGDSGVATVTFASPIYNGSGPDFAVFENGFANPVDASQAYLELAFVEVSSDGVHYVRFPANSLTQDTTQIRGAGDYMDASYLHNLAGKYISNYGTPFDLEELSGAPNLDVNNITHIRIVDVIGSIGEHASRDSADRKINDPYPTPYPTGGFDLDAVGAIHEKGMAVGNVPEGLPISVYPNPATDRIYITNKGAYQGMTLMLSDMTGAVLYHQQVSQAQTVIPISELRSGMYYLVIRDTNGNKWVEKVTKL